MKEICSSHEYSFIMLNTGNFAGCALSGHWFHRIRHNEAFAEDTSEREHKAWPRFCLKLLSTKERHICEVPIGGFKPHQVHECYVVIVLRTYPSWHILFVIFFQIHFYFFTNMYTRLYPLGGMLSLDSIWWWNYRNVRQTCSTNLQLHVLPKNDSPFLIYICFELIFKNLCLKAHLLSTASFFCTFLCWERLCICFVCPKVATTRLWDCKVQFDWILFGNQLFYHVSSFSSEKTSDQFIDYHNSTKNTRNTKLQLGLSTI